MTPPELNDLRVVNAIPAHIWRSAPDGASFVSQQWMDYTGLSQENSVNCPEYVRSWIEAEQGDA